MSNHFHFRYVLACLLFACVFGATISTSSQTQRPGGQQSPDTVVVDTGEVRLDVVVRDKRGRVIKDLEAADFEVYEDGVKQDVGSFRFVSALTQKVTKGATTTPPSKPNDSGTIKGVADGGAVTTKSASEPEVAGVSAIALVFDRLSTDARLRATQAALNYLQQSENRSELFGVYLTDLSVLVLQPLTNDRELVKAGIQKASVYSPSLYKSTNEEARNMRQILINNANQLLVHAGSTDGRPSPTTAASLTSGGAMASLNLGLLERAEEDQRDQLGDATTRGLLHIASSLRGLPGRKAVILFSEGLTLPPSAMQDFAAIIDAATRSNVSFYTVDAAGLRAESKTLETSKEISSRNELRMVQLATSADPDGPMTKGLERNEDLLRLDPDSGLGQLANQTGGFLITDSNDLKDRLRQVDEDLHAYYLLSYRSRNQLYDGHFRKIEVKVKRSGLAVQSRKGYFAVKGTFVSPVLGYEALALAASENAQKSNSFSVRAGGFSFPEWERPGLVPVLADVPLSEFTFTKDEEKKSYQTDFAILALVKNQSGHVVQKLSKHYQLSGPLEQIEKTKQRRALFYREANLDPGRYTLEMIAYDVPTGRVSVRSEAIEIEASSEDKLRMSDVVILERAESISAADDGNPFRIGNVIVNPNLGDPIQRSLKQLPFFLTVYLPVGTSTQPGPASIELRQQGRTLAQIAGDLPQPDAAGRIRYLAGLPLEKIPAGVYELRVTVTDGTMSRTRSAHFTIED